MPKISLLVFTSRPEDVTELQQHLDESHWELTNVPRWEDAAGMLKAAAVPILLFDRDAARLSWQELNEEPDTFAAQRLRRVVVQRHRPISVGRSRAARRLRSAHPALP